MMLKITIKTKENSLCIVFLKQYREVACFDLADRLFHSFAPLQEKHLWPFADLFISSLRSVPISRRLYDQQDKLQVKRSHKYCKASSFRDLKTIVLDSPEASSLTVFHPNPLIRGLLGASKLLFVIILAAPF